MRKSKFNSTQIVKILKEFEAYIMGIEEREFAQQMWESSEKKGDNVEYLQTTT